MIMSGSPPPRSSQLPTSPSGYSRPRRTRKPPDRFGVYETPDLVLSSEEDEDPDLTLVQLSPVRLSASSASPRLPTNSVTCSIRLPTPPCLMMSPESGVLKICYRYFLESSVIFFDMIVLDTDFLLSFFSLQL